MRKLIVTLLAPAAFALPATALAHDGGGKRLHHGWHHGHGAFAKLTGTGTSFGSATATASGTLAGRDALATGTFSASLSTSWSSATTKTFDRGTLSCAPATGSLTLAGAAAGDTVAASLTGKTCTWTKTDGTVLRGFFAKGTADGSGALASLDGFTERAFLTQKADGTVQGGVVAGSHGRSLSLFAVREHVAAQRTGDCDHH